MTADTPRLRLGVVAIVALSLFAALLARLWYLQVLEAPDFQVRAQANQLRVVSEPAPRGRILDRNGKVLVTNRASNVVAVDRALFSDLEERDQEDLLDRLAGVLEITRHELDERLESQRVSPYTPVPVAEDVKKEKMTLLLERADEFPSVVAKRIAVRHYPMGNIAPHILGWVTEVNEADMEQFPDQYELGDQIGRTGIERYFEADLRGKDGLLEIEVDAKGKPIRIAKRVPPQQGHDLVLTIDADVQRAAERALDQGLADTRGRPFEDDKRPLKANAGSVVVLDTKGGVEAMASWPTFDLPTVADGLTDAEAAYLYPQEVEGQPKPDPPSVNLAIAGQYAPGSTWKLVTADAALRKGLITPGFTYDDNGVYEIQGECAGRGCIKRNAGSTPWGLVDVRRALAVSSDVFFYYLGDEFWIDRDKWHEEAIQQSARLYGFGQETGVQLPSEAAGRVLTPKIKRELFDDGSALVADGEWYSGQNVDLAIGQQVMLATPIQIANAYATLATGGARYQPNLALRVQTQDGKVVRELQPRLAERIDIAEPIRSALMDGFSRAVSYEKGTAYNAFLGFPLDRFGVAGKTGTAQAGLRQDTALFTGFGPTQDLANGHVVSVVMEQSGFGASAAAPVARHIFDVLAGVGNQSGPVQFTPINGVGD